MKLSIQSLHFTEEPKLNDFVTKKVNELSHFYDRIESANVCLKQDKSDKTESKVCEIRLSIPGNDLFAKQQCKTFEEAVNEVVTVLRRQITKMKTKFDTH